MLSATGDLNQHIYIVIPKEPAATQAAGSSFIPIDDIFGKIVIKAYEKRNIVELHNNIIGYDMDEILPEPELLC